MRLVRGQPKTDNVTGKQRNEGTESEKEEVNLQWPISLCKLSVSTVMLH